MSHKLLINHSNNKNLFKWYNQMLAIIFFLLVMVASLLTASILNANQEKLRLKQLEILELKQKVTELEELIIHVDTLVQFPEIPKLLNDEVINTLHQMQVADPDDNITEAALSNAEERGQQFLYPDREQHLNRLMQSDAQVARAQKTLKETARKVKNFAFNHSLTDEEKHQYLEELKWQHSQVEVISLIGQGHKAMRRNEIINAHAFYKRAQQKLLRQHQADSRAKQQIHQLDEVISQQRTALDLNLMPESFLNPPSIKKPKFAKVSESTSDNKNKNSQDSKDQKSNIIQAA